MTQLNTFEHVVVLMLENRSFDNLLGYLYKDGVPTGKSYEGLQNGDYPNPVPKRAKDYETVKEIRPQRAKDLSQPFPDPGEFYQHANTQLYNTIDPVSNVGIDGMDMTSPYNLPNPVPSTASMNGFVNDYLNTLQAYGSEKKYPQYKKPTKEQYGAIMQCYYPDQVPHLSTLAKEFAVFDHWHCSVPSQTWCNRAFWHMGTSGGFVINPVGEKGESKDPLKNEKLKKWYDRVGYGRNATKHDPNNPNLFTRLNDKNITANVYADSKFCFKIFGYDYCLSLTKLMIGGLYSTGFTNYKMGKFYSHIKDKKLPKYSFIEPNFFNKHNDMHPSAVNKEPVESVKLGDELIRKVYNALFIDSDHYKDNTLLIITTDEHGGCFDHVSPPSATPPDDYSCKEGFKFDRLGIRVPMVMVSAYIQKNTIINDVHDHTSFIKTMSKKWGLEGLHNRDKNAKSFESVFSNKKRSDFPKLGDSIVDLDEVPDHSDHELNGLQASILGAAEYLAQQHPKADKIPPRDEDINTIGEAERRLEVLAEFLNLTDVTHSETN